jgi:hypothetical protein
MFFFPYQGAVPKRTGREPKVREHPKPQVLYVSVMRIQATSLCENGSPIRRSKGKKLPTMNRHITVETV